MRILACVRVCVWSFVYKGESCGLRSGSSSEAGTLNISVTMLDVSIFVGYSYSKEVAKYGNVYNADGPSYGETRMVTFGLENLHLYKQICDLK